MPSRLPAEAQRVGEALVTPPDVETRESGTAMLADVPVPPRRRGRSSRVSSREERVAGYAFVSPFFIMFGIFGLFPIVFTLWVSLHDWSLLGGKEGWAGMANYSALLHDDNFWNALVNTLGIFVLATVPQLLFALGLAQLLNERLRARTFWRMGVLLPNITSVAAVGIIFTLLFARDFGLVNWLLGFVGVEPIAWQDHRWSSWLAISVMVDWRWTGYNALIFLAALQAVPKDLYEAAAIDGASKWRQFWSISVPLLRPTIVFVTLISTIGGIQLFTEPLLFNSGANAITGGTTRQFQTLTMYLYEKAFTGLDFGYAAAIAWGMFVVIAIVGAINALLLRRLRSVD
jgi:cellobiose transport system permease protein